MVCSSAKPDQTGSDLTGKHSEHLLRKEGRFVFSPLHADYSFTLCLEEKRFKDSLFGGNMKTDENNLTQAYWENMPSFTFSQKHTICASEAGALS